MGSNLTNAHAKTLERLVAHPAPHNVQWRDVCSMFTAMDDALSDEDIAGNLTVTRRGQTLRLHRPSGKDISDLDEIVRLRHFLKAATEEAQAAIPAGTHLLVIIDHREARIYDSEMSGSIPQKITPYDPFGFGRALHYNQDDSNGQRKPELKSFYEAVAKTLRRAKAILIFGTGTGSSSAMDQLLKNLAEHHHDISTKIIGSSVVDERHLTEDQLLAKARALFAEAESAV